MCKVGADDADGRQPRIEKEEHGHAQGAGTYRAQRHKHAEHRTEDHGDRARVTRSRRVVSAESGHPSRFSSLINACTQWLTAEFPTQRNREFLNAYQGSHTVWQSKATFEAWTKSEAFRLAHRDAGQNKPLYLDHPQFEGFEVRQTVRRGEDAVA